jgi:hypothetical protein
MCEVIRGKDHHDTYLADYISFSLNQRDNIPIQLQLDVNAYPIKLYVKPSAIQWGLSANRKSKPCQSQITSTHSSGSSGSNIHMKANARQFKLLLL